MCLLLNTKYHKLCLFRSYYRRFWALCFCMQFRAVVLAGDRGKGASYLSRGQHILQLSLMRNARCDYQQRLERVAQWLTTVVWLKWFLSWILLYALALSWSSVLCATYIHVNNLFCTRPVWLHSLCHLLEYCSWFCPVVFSQLCSFYSRSAHLISVKAVKCRFC